MKATEQDFPVVLFIMRYKMVPIDNFTVVCLVTWPLNGIEAEGDLVLI